MIFGNWEVTDNGISGLDSMKNFNLTLDDLVFVRDGYVDILVHVSSKSIVNEEEVVNLNKAYEYARKKFKINIITNEIMSTTIKEQMKHV